MAKQLTRNVAISTGGGDAPGLNAVIRAVVKSASYVHGWRVYGIRDGFDGLLNGEPLVELTPASVRGILPRGGTILGTSSRGNPFARKVIVDGQEVIVDQAQMMLDRLDELGIEGMILVGGEGTMHIAADLIRLGAQVVGVPKTIDNDLPGTDVTFGFDTALHTATDAIDKLHTTAEAHHRVMVCEVMGRHAGWIALNAGLAGGADVILIPEIPFSIERVCAKVEERNARGANFSIIVVAEGAFPIGGRPIYRAYGVSGTASRLGGIGRWVADAIAERCSVEVRSIVLGHLQRGGSPSPYDRILATRLGAAAMRLVAQRKWGRMVALRGTEIVDVPILEVAAAGMKQVDPEGELVRTARDLGIELGAPPAEQEAPAQEPQQEWVGGEQG